MKPTVFSNISNDSLFFEIYNSNVLISMDWDDITVQFQYIFELKSKISRIFSEQSGNNIIVKFEDDNDLVLIKREKNLDRKPGDNLYTNVKPYSVSLNKLPEKLKNKDFVSFSLENINEKVILFAVNEDGFFFALELTEQQVKDKCNGDYQCNEGVLGIVKKTVKTMFPEEEESLLEILVRYVITNMIPLILYLKYVSSVNNKADYKIKEFLSNKKVQKMVDKLNKLEEKIKNENLRNMVIK